MPLKMMNSKYEPKQRIKKVYVIGAGFSKALAGLPTIGELYKSIIDNSVEYSNIKIFKNKVYSDGYSPNFEEFLGLLDSLENKKLITIFNKLSTSFEEVETIKKLLLKGLVSILWPAWQKIVGSNSEFQPLRLFCKNLKYAEAIVTFNYDVVIETALMNGDRMDGGIPEGDIIESCVWT